MYISYLGNLNLHIDTCMKLYFLLYQPFEEKYNCSSSSLSCALSPHPSRSRTHPHTHTLPSSVSPNSLLLESLSPVFFFARPSRFIQCLSVLGLLLLIYPLIFQSSFSHFLFADALLISISNLLRSDSFSQEYYIQCS